MRKRSEAGPPPRTNEEVLAGAVRNVEPDPWDLKGQSTAVTRSTVVDHDVFDPATGAFSASTDPIPASSGIDFDKMADDLRKGEADAVDSVVEVNVGEELFQPVQYNSFRHGGFKVAARVRKGETIAATIERVYHEAAKAFDRTYPEKRDGYLQRLRELGQDVERLRR